jgi:hypothetical protein
VRIIETNMRVWHARREGPRVTIVELMLLPLMEYNECSGAPSSFGGWK